MDKEKAKKTHLGSDPNFCDKTGNRGTEVLFKNQSSLTLAPYKWN